MLHNQKIHDVLDTITSKAVLILGRFTAERKAVLDTSLVARVRITEPGRQAVAEHESTSL
jgi:hypothetical protein